MVGDDVVIEHYEAWKKQLVYIVYSETNVLTDKTVKKFILSPKRGTPKYSRRVMGKFRKAFNFGRHLKYFERNTSDKYVYGSMLHVVLEFDSNRFEKGDCWIGVGVALNLYMSMLKRRFGSKVACIRTYESMISGYPHIHCILYFPNYIFKGTKMKGIFRVCGNDWRELKKCWKSGFSNIRMVDGFHGALRYLYKYVAKSVSYKEAMKATKPNVKRKLLLGLALCWLYNKRSFSISNEKLFHTSVLPVNNDEIRKIRYFIDDKEEILFNNTRVADDIFPKVQYHSIELTNLTEGSHVLRIEVFTEHEYKSTSDPDTYLYTPQSVNFKTTTANPVIFNIATNTPTPTPTPTPSPEPESFPTTLAVASIAIIAVIGVGILVYFKKLRS